MRMRIAAGVVACLLIVAGCSENTAYYDTCAKADVATLGKEIATYYVDHDSPAPEISIKDGQYYLLDAAVADVTEGTRLTGQYYRSPVDWCVEVTNDKGEFKTYTYSALGGLQNGTC
jgi:type IV pilus assembly protein PilA